MTGELVESPAKGQPFEMRATRSRSSAGSTTDTTRCRRSATLRVPAHDRAPAPAHEHARRGDARAPRRARAIHRFFDERGFLWVHTPIITAVDAEGAGAMFRVDPHPANARTPSDAHRRTSSAGHAFLTVSGQLEAEIGALALSNVYTFGPTFRAENSNTSRHLAEFWMIEPEIAFAISRQRGARGGVPARLLEAVLDGGATTCASSTSASTKGVVATLEHVVATPSSA